MTVYVIDPQTGKVVVREELARRQARRSSGKKATIEVREVERGRWVYRDGKAIPAHEYYAPREEVNAPMVIGEIGEYQSPIDGTVISTRQAHRDHMKKHGVFEVGNEVLTPAPKERPDPRYAVKESIEKLRAGHPVGKAKKASADIEGDGIRIVG